MNSFGKLFRVSIYGESHGTGCGVVVDGCPAGIELKVEDFSEDMKRRQAGRKGTTPRNEPDQAVILNGVYQDKTTGSPIHIRFENTNTRSKDYDLFRAVPRPGHADFVAERKYDTFEDPRGGGHFSGRITLGIVAAGVIAKKIASNIEFDAELIEAGGQKDIEKAIDEIIDTGDSIGGIVEVTVKNMPIGIGDPFFESVESKISQMVFSIPATKGIEFGTGFAVAKMKGSEANDTFVDASGKTSTNHTGGINGGITNGNDIVFRVAVKPTSSISKAQETFNFKTNEMTTLEVPGRHDACIALRIPVVLENATAIVIADLLMTSQTFKIKNYQ